jgi:hypothetical protein
MTVAPQQTPAERDSERIEVRVDERGRSRVKGTYSTVSICAFCRRPE